MGLHQVDNAELLLWHDTSKDNLLVQAEDILLLWCESLDECCLEMLLAVLIYSQ